MKLEYLFSEQLFNRSHTRSKHGIVTDADTAFPNCSDINPVPQHIQVLLSEGDFTDEAKFQALIKWQNLQGRIEVIKAILNFGYLIGGGGSSKRRLDLKAVVVRWIVAGGDHHSNSIVVQCRPAYGRRGGDR